MLNNNNNVKGFILSCDKTGKDQGKVAYANVWENLNNIHQNS